MLWRPPRYSEAGPFHESDLKICDLCGALNLADNEACFVCGWEGHFEKRPEVVRMAMELLERQYGRIELRLITDVHQYRGGRASRFSLWGRIQRFWGRAMHWLFG